jgi:hypothetical protein
MNDSNPPATPMDKPFLANSNHLTSSPAGDELLVQLLDVCRNGTDDLGLPETAPLAAALATGPEWRVRWEAAQTENTHFRRQLEDVPLPAGLEARLRSKLGLATAEAVEAGAVTEEAGSVTEAAGSVTEAAGSVTEAAGAVIVAAGAVTVVAGAVTQAAQVADAAVLADRVAPSRSRSRSTSRRWFLVAGLASVSVAVAFALLRWQSENRTTLPDSSEALANLGRQWADSVAASADWRSETNDLPEDREARTTVVGERTRWRTLRTTCDRQTHVVEVRRGLVGAWLFSFRGSLPYLKSYLTPVRLSGSGESDVWAWSDGSLVFVLVAQTPESRLDSWIRRPKFAVSPTPPAHVLPSQSPKSLQAERPLLSTRHDHESRGRGLACVGFHGLFWASWRQASS